MRFLLLISLLLLTGCTRLHFISYGVNYLCNLDPITGTIVKASVDTMTMPHQIRINCYGKEELSTETPPIPLRPREPQITKDNSGCYREIIPENYDPLRDITTNRY